jgi:hypothetical protein
MVSKNCPMFMFFFMSPLERPLPTRWQKLKTHLT